MKKASHNLLQDIPQVESCYGERVSFIVGNIYDNPELLKQIKKSNFFKLQVNENTLL
nr:MAG TPA: YopX protein [Caudoviricetes sp.]